MDSVYCNEFLSGMNTLRKEEVLTDYVITIDDIEHKVVSYYTRDMIIFSKLYIHINLNIKYCV